MGAAGGSRVRDFSFIFYVAVSVLRLKCQVREFFGGMVSIVFASSFYSKEKMSFSSILKKPLGMALNRVVGSARVKFF